jgi:hypothetical protein
MAPDLGTGVPGYPNPNSFVGNVASDPATPGDNTWWFNTTEGAVKGYVVNGATAEVVRFVPNASGTTIIDQDTTLPAGSYSYNNLLVTNDATLTLDGGANVIVTGTASILAGASVVMGVGGSGSSFYAGNLLNAGTLTSSNAADLISLQNSSNNGTNTIAGELIFLAGGTHDLSSGIAGTGVTDVSNGATLSIPAGFTVNFSCTTLKGSGTIAVRDGATFNVAENLSIGSSAPIFSGPGTLQVNSPYTLTVTAAAETYSIGAIAGTGTVAFGTATITIGANSVWSVAALTFTGVLNFTGTDTTLEISVSYSLGVTLVTGANSSIITVDTGKTLTFTAPIDLDGGTLTGAGAIAFGANAVTVTTSETITVASYTATGTLTITGAAVTLTMGASYTLGFTTVAGTGILSVGSTFTLTVGATASFTVAKVAGAGTLSIGNTFSVTTDANASWSVATVTGAGTLSITATFTLTIGAAETWTMAHLAGTGTVTMGSGVVLTLGASIPMSAATVFAGAGTLSVGSTFTLTVGASPTWTVANVAGLGTVSVSGTFTLTVGANSNWSVAAVAGAGTLSVSSTFTLTANSGITLSVATVAGLGTVAFGASTVTIAGNESWTVTSYTATGTLTVNVSVTLTYGANYTLGFTAVTGSGTVAFGATTLTVNSNTAWSIASYTASGSLSVTGAATVLTMNASYTLGFTTLLSSAGTISVGGGYTLTVGAGVSWGVTGSVSGAGTLSVSGGITLTLAGVFASNIAAITGSGTINAGSSYNVVQFKSNCSWSLANYTCSTAGGGFTVFNGVTLTISGATTLTAGTGGAAIGDITTSTTGILGGSGAITFVGVWYQGPSSGTVTPTYTGTVTVTGATTIVLWIDSRLSRGTTAGAVLSVPFTVNGTGCFLMAPVDDSASAGTGTITFTVGTLTAGTPSGATGTASTKAFSILGNASSTWAASVAGNYYLGVKDTAATTYAIPFFIYFGGTGAFTLGPAIGTGQTVNDSANAANSTDTMAVYLSTGSAGNIAIAAASQVFKC